MSVLVVHVCPAQVSPSLVTVAGEIDIASAPRLRRRLLTLPDDATIIELSGVRLLSAAGLTELVDIRNRLARVGAPLALAAALPPARRVLTITGIAATVIVTDTVDDAIRLLTATSTSRPHTLETMTAAGRPGLPRPPSTR